MRCELCTTDSPCPVGRKLLGEFEEATLTYADAVTTRDALDVGHRYATAAEMREANEDVRQLRVIQVAALEALKQHKNESWNPDEGQTTKDPAPQDTESAGPSDTS